MRLRCLIAALALVVGGCHDAPTSPFRTTTSIAPAGLPVAFTVDSVSPKSARSIVVAGDTVVVTDQFTAGLACMVPSASAGVENGALVVTVVSAFQTEPCYIALIALNQGGPFFRATVRSVPRGQYTVIVRERLQQQAGTPAFYERDLAHGTVTVR